MVWCGSHWRQAAVAIRLLAELFSSDHPDAINVLSKDIYVDDVNPGVETEAGQDNQILATQSVLQQGGFGFKYVVVEFKFYSQFPRIFVRR